MKERHINFFVFVIALILPYEHLCAKSEFSLLETLACEPQYIEVYDTYLKKTLTNARRDLATVYYLYPEKDGFYFEAKNATKKYKYTFASSDDGHNYFVPAEKHFQNISIKQIHPEGIYGALFWGQTQLNGVLIKEICLCHPRDRKVKIDSKK